MMNYGVLPSVLRRFSPALGGAALALVATLGCGSPAKDATFTGTWNRVNENGISGQKQESVARVTTGAGKFRIETTTEEATIVEVYDGETLTETFTYHPNPNLPDEIPQPAVTATKRSNFAMDSKRFWKGAFSGSATAGGLIAGRDTLLYQAQENRIDGQVTIQAWVDSDTGLVLKKIFTVYSSQVQQMVTKVSDECTALTLGPVADSAFAVR